MHSMTSSRIQGSVLVRTTLALVAACTLGAAVATMAAAPAAALSEIGREDLPPPSATPGAPGDEAVEPGGGAPSQQAPAPGELSPSPQDDAAAVPDSRSDLARPDIDENGPLPEVVYNLDRLPEPVRRMHDRLVEAARSGDLERLRPFLGLGDGTTQLSFGEVEGDPIAFLKSLSGDSGGQEILAILEEVLNAGFVHLEAGSPDEIYVWPYFFGLPLDKLDARQRVELFKLITAGDYEDMKQFGAYIFYRIGITPDGRWAFFVAGE